MSKNQAQVQDNTSPKSSLFEQKAKLANECEHTMWAIEEAVKKIKEGKWVQITNTKIRIEDYDLPAHPLMERLARELRDNVICSLVVLKGNIKSDYDAI